MEKNSTVEKDLAEKLLEIGAVTVADEKNLFTWVSGIKAPIYCDNRLTISYPHVREAIATGFVNAIKSDKLVADVIAGTATAGIPHAAWVAQKLDKPMIYVRSTSKGHGKGQQIEGVLKPGSQVVLIEDLISTGGSSLKAVEAIESVGAKVEKVYGIFQYNFHSTVKRFKNFGVQFSTLTDYKTLLPIAILRGDLEKEAESLLMKWCEDPYIFTQKV